MAASSSSTQQQVFINFRGKDIRYDFVDYLVHEMKLAGINVFTDKDEVKGTELDNLFVRIKESELVIVIFSKNYTTSSWCLDELVKINKCAGKGTLMAIPIFYKLEASDVHDIKGDFGINFEALKRENPTKWKWEKAITSISVKSGMSLPEVSQITNRDFISSVVVEVKRSLEHIANKKERTGTSQVQQQPAAIQIRQPDASSQAAIQIRQPDVSSQGCIFNVKQLKISSSHNARYWTFESISESPNGAAFEVAKMKRCYYLEVSGKFDASLLTWGKRYEVVFVAKVEDSMSRWDNPAMVQLMVPDKALQEREVQFVDLIKNEWIYIQAGVFEAQPHKEKVGFYLCQYKPELMTGLIVKGAIIRPME